MNTGQKEEVLCSGGNTMKFVKVTNEDGTKVVKFSYTLNFDLKEDIFNSVFNDKNAKELMERVNSVLSGDRCA
jgi:hypothetical protein